MSGLRPRVGLLAAGLVFLAPFWAAESGWRPGGTGVQAAAAATPDASDSGARSGDETEFETKPATSTAPSPSLSGGAGQPNLISSGVTVGQLGTIDGPIVGLLDDSNGGLGQDMWLAANREKLEGELNRIPAVTTDRFVRGLARRLLLTASEAPAGTAHHALITLRMEKLLDAGFIDEAGVLASNADVPNDPEFARVSAEAFLYAGRPEVCGDRTGTRLKNAEPFWLELRAVCYAAAGDFAAADLTLSVFEAQGASDSAFPVLLDDLERKQGVAPLTFAHPTAVDVWLLRRLGLPVTLAIAASLGTPADLIASRDLRNAPVERLKAAEQIVRTGALTKGDLARLADAQPFSVDERRSLGNGLPFLARQSLIRQLALLATRPSDRLALIANADPDIGGDGLYQVFAEMEAPVIAATSPLAADPKQAWGVARALILGGNATAADSWLPPPDNPMTAQAALAIDLDAPSADEDARAQAALAWFAAHSSEASGGWSAATALTTNIWHVLGLAAPIVSSGNPSGPTVPPPLIRFDGIELPEKTIQAIDASAADPQRRGEAVLLLIDAIGPRGPARFAPDADVYLVSKLEQLKLDDAARQLAVEVLLLGPPHPQHWPSSGPPVTVTPSVERATPEAQ